MTHQTMRLGTILKTARGRVSRVQFARRLGLSYTFVRAMEHGQRFPSDPVLQKIAEILELDPAELLLAAYCDRSPALADVLIARGVQIPEGAPVEPDVEDRQPEPQPVATPGHTQEHAAGAQGREEEAEELRPDDDPYGGRVQISAQPF